MKDIVITGALGGMGRATALSLRDAGYRVFALDVEACEREENIIPIRVDVTSEESVISVFEEVRSQADSLFAVIHFAGIYMLDSLVEMREESFKRIFEVNTYGVYLVNKIFFPLMKEGARVIITTSELALLDPLPFTGIYAVTKAALDKYV